MVCRIGAIANINSLKACHALLSFIVSLTFLTMPTLKASAASPVSTQPTAAWSQLPPAQWPQLVLTNDASFVGHSPLHGASAFLMKMPNGEVVVATAKHLIGKAGGVDPPLTLPTLDESLAYWKVFPRTHDSEGVEAKGLAERSSGEKFHDWLLLHLAGSSAKLPATPLIPRTDPIQIGEKVFLIGVSYADQDSAQNVYEGVITSRPKSNYFTYEFHPPVHINGFSGAPIVDRNGLLVGHGVSRTTPLKQENGMEVEFGGEDASLALQLWLHRSDSPATQPADAFHVQLPPGWVAKVSKLPGSLQFAEYPPLLAYAELTAESKADLGDTTDLAYWAKLSQARTAKASKLQNREETNLHGGRIGDRDVLEYETTGEVREVKLQYRHILFECNGCYCSVTCWTVPSHWDDAQAKFNEFARAIK